VMRREVTRDDSATRVWACVPALRSHSNGYPQLAKKIRSNT
jgi:hypothetical protein